MISPLSVGTDGYLCNEGFSRSLVAIATDGYLACIQIPAKIPVVITDNVGYTGDDDVKGPSIDTGERVRFKTKEADIDSQNDAIMAVIKTFIKCQDENIL